MITEEKSHGACSPDSSRRGFLFPVAVSCFWSGELVFSARLAAGLGDRGVVLLLASAAVFASAVLFCKTG